MARRYANFWSRAAARLTGIAHTQAPLIRWGVLIILVAVWIGLGMVFWLHLGVAEALYRTIGAVSMSDDYFGVSDQDRNAVRFAALAVPVVGLLFAFSGALGRHLADAFNAGAANHIVIAGDGPPAISLALDCRKARDSVILIAQDVPEETALGLRRKGVVVFDGDARQLETLRAARANHAAHVVAFEDGDTANLQIEAAVRRLVGNSRRRDPLDVHVATRSTLLLKEAREMRSAQARTKTGSAAIDPKPFSLEEMAARWLIQRESQTLLSLAAQTGQDRVHLVFFGFDAGAELVAERVFSSLWSSHFQAPRITVLTPNAEAAEAGLRARRREAFAHPELWTADIAFLPFDWDAASVGHELLDVVERTRGKPTAIVVSTGADPGNIHLAITLKRICNHAYRWPVPIFMRETSQSEFSQQYARGDETEQLDAYLLAFGAHQMLATRAMIIEGALDQGAAIAHEHYNKGLNKKDTMSMRELQAAMRDWGEVLETYRAANRAVADSALTKLWDAGWRPALKGEKGEHTPAVPAEEMAKLAEREHDRWVAERLIAGWRPTTQGEQRNNDLMAHDKLAPWSAMNEGDRSNDEVQVRAAIDIARVMYKDGFVRR
ncbi:MAG: NAD-binding protein [Terricaulis sp.]